VGRKGDPAPLLLRGCFTLGGTHRRGVEEKATIVSLVRFCITVAASLLSLAPTSVLSAVEPPIGLELVEVNKIWDYAPHNAFTDLVRFQDQWYLSFREADSHAVSGDGDVRVIRSTDGTNWESVALLDYDSGWDMRDAKLHVTADGRLMLNTAAAPLAASSQRQSLVWFTYDGADWSNGPYEIGEPNWWLWGVEVHPTSGDVYGVGYGPTTSHPRTTRLYRSSDGIDYATIVPTLTSDAETGETAIIFRNDAQHTAVALVRENTGAERSLVGTASGDYTDWTFQVVDKRVGGPELIELPDGNILAGSRLYDPVQRTSLSWIDPDTGQMTELLTLPSGGDTSYPGLVWHDGLLWMSYYSSHEDKTSIYLAKVRVTVPEPPDPPPPAGTMQFQEEVQPNTWYTAGAAHIRTDITDGESDLVIVGEAANHEKTLRGVFSFDLSALPEGAHVVNVSLTLSADRDNTEGTGGPSVDGDFTLDLHQLAASFVESEVTWDQRADGQPWNTPGGDFLDPPLASLEANPYRLLSEGPDYRWEATTDFILAAQAALDAGLPLDLLLRTPDGETQENRVVFYFHSDDATDPAQHPLLTITYTTIPGDATGDGIVDEEDAEQLASNWGTAGATWNMGDFDGDRLVGPKDAAILAANWGYGVTEASTVPEPAAAFLLAGILLAALRRRGRRR